MEAVSVTPSSPATPPRFLVVEDDPVIGAVCVRLLQLSEYKVDHVDNGGKALQQLAKSPYDIILTDLHMPVLDGLELLRQVKQDYPNTDVIMVTGYASIDTARQALKLGAFDYLTKPLDLDDLTRVVQTCLESRELKRLRQERETLSEMMAVMELSRTISAKLDLDAQVHDFTSQLFARFHPNGVALSLLDPSEQALRLLMQRGMEQAQDIGKAVPLKGIRCNETIINAHMQLVQSSRADAQTLRVLHVQERPVGVLQMIWENQPVTLDQNEFQLLEVFVSSMAVALENSRLYGKLKQLNLQTVAALAAAIDARDPYTRGHSEQVTKYAVQIAQAMGQPPTWIERLHYGALLHDIGKIGIPDAILLKPGPLTAVEMQQMRKHAEIGARIVEQVLDEVAPIVRHHHEAYDGSGYPNGLSGKAIPLEARIIAVADAFDAMTSDRAYRKAMPIVDALAVLQSGRDQQWQGNLLDLLADMIKREGDTLLADKARTPQIPLLEEPSLHSSDLKQ
jgi:putative nucleotidyltransferase with HDIG domain